MTEQWKIVSPALATLVAIGSACADMMPVSRLDAGCRQWVCAHEQARPQAANCSSVFVQFPPFGAADVGLPSIRFLIQAQTNAGQASRIRPVRLLADGWTNPSVFLCALMTLWAFRSTAGMKKTSFGGLIPDWYHKGDPVRIDRGLAVGPDLRFAPVCCSVQPGCLVADRQPQYSQGTMVSLWRKSQFTFMVLASRGPPSLANGCFPRDCV